MNSYLKLSTLSFVVHRLAKADHIACKTSFKLYIFSFSVWKILSWKKNSPQAWNNNIILGNKFVVNKRYSAKARVKLRKRPRQLPRITLSNQNFRSIGF